MKVYSGTLLFVGFISIYLVLVFSFGFFSLGQRDACQMLSLHDKIDYDKCMKLVHTDE
jgi:hypothetical protein